MPNLQANDIADLVAMSLNDLGRLKFTDLMSDYQNTVVLKRLMRKGKQTFDSGPNVAFNVITSTNGSARFVGLGAQDIVDIPDVMTTGVVPWRHSTWNWAHEQREPIMNSGASKIVDIIKTRRISAFGDGIKLLERAFWRAPPATGAGSDTEPYGVPYYIVKSNTATTTNDGFNGSVPSGYTTVAGLNPTTYIRWRNYATQYTAVTKDDLIRKMRRAQTYTDFMPLVEEVPEYNSGNDYGIYTNYAVVGTMEELLEAQNDNLGKDIASMDGKTLFRGIPIVFVKELDLDTTNPVYGINWGEFGAMGLRGWWLKETVVGMVAGQHTVGAVHTDCTFNFLCRNRRRNWVLATDTTLPA